MARDIPMLMDSPGVMTEDLAASCDTEAVAATRSGAIRAVEANEPAVMGARYGADRRVSGHVVACVIALHAGILAAALLAKPDLARSASERLRMVEVSLEPPPPPTRAPEAQPPPPEAAAPRMVRPPVMLTPQVVAAEIVDVLPPPRPPVPQPVASAPAALAPAPAAAPPAVVSEGDIGTRMISGKPPRYPVESRRKREQGTVVLALMLALDGSVADISIARSSGFARLDDAARGAVRKWRWAPTLRDGVPVLVRGVVEIPFVLQG